MQSIYLIIINYGARSQFILTSCASTNGYDPGSQSPNHQAMISKMLEEDRRAPQQVRDRFDFGVWIGSLFYCLMFGVCNVGPNVQCGVQGVQGCNSMDIYMSQNLSQFIF